MPVVLDAALAAQPHLVLVAMPLGHGERTWMRLAAMQADIEVPLFTVAGRLNEDNGLHNSAGSHRHLLWVF